MGRGHGCSVTPLIYKVIGLTPPPFSRRRNVKIKNYFLFNRVGGGIIKLSAFKVNGSDGTTFLFCSLDLFYWKLLKVEVR